MKVTHQSLIEEYEITPYTLMVLPINYGSKIYSRIIELEDDFITPFKPIDIINKSCEYFGSNYEGRKQGTKQIMGITHKVPVAIDPSNSIFFFPTTSPLRPQCIWLSHDHVMSFTRLDQQHTTVVFRNKQSITINMSSSSFENQLHRTAFLKTKLVQRIEETKRKSFYLYNQSEWSQASEKVLDYVACAKDID